MKQGMPAAFNIQIGDELTWNVQPLLHEIRHALQELAGDGKTGIIDLRSIPLAPGEEDKILAALGRGEVEAHIDALGPSEIYETRYPGVWLITHYNEAEEVIGRFIEITDMPDILRSQADEIRQSCDRLAEYLESAGDEPATSEETVP